MGKKAVRNQSQKSEEKSSVSSQLEKIRSELRTEFGEDSVRTYDRIEGIRCVSTGIIALDKALGGGFPLNRMVELVGNSGAGKTSVMISCMAEAQRQFPDKIVVYIDAEHALDIGWAVRLGISLDRFDHIQPTTAEEALTILERYGRSGMASVIGVDSVPALLPAAEMEGEIGDANIGIQARIIAQELRRIGSILLNQKDLVIVFVNQRRAQLQSRGGFSGHEPTKSTGGMALPFYMTTRLEVYKLATKKNTNDVEVGQQVGVYVKKHKVNEGPGARISFEIDNKIGIDTAKELLDIAVTKDLVVKAGSWFTFSTGEKMQGEESAKQLIREKYLTKWKEDFNAEEKVKASTA